MSNILRKKGISSIRCALREEGFSTTLKADDLLTSAVECNRIDLVERLLDIGADINCRSKTGCTPLFLASIHGFIDIVELLLHNKANVNIVMFRLGFFPIHAASQEGHVDIVRLLLDNNSDIESKGREEYTPLCIASKDGQDEVVKLLLARKANVNAATVNGAQPLYLASERGHRNVVLELLNKGAEIEAIDQNDFTALYVASYNGHTDIVDILLQREAKYEFKEWTGMSPLNAASVGGHQGVVERLLSFGADPFSQDQFNFNAIDNSATNGHANLVKFFLQYLKNTMPYGKYRTLAMRIITRASEYGQTDVILTAAGLMDDMDINMTDEAGISPLEAAICNSQLGSVKVLHSLGANLSSLGSHKIIDCIAKSGSMEIYHFLLIVGLGYKAVDASGHTARHYLFPGEGYEQEWETIEHALSPRHHKKPSLSAAELVSTKGLGSVNNIPKQTLKEIYDTVEEKVDYDVKKALKLNYIRGVVKTGGSAESTKVGLPDEFDFMLVSDGYLGEDDLKSHTHGYYDCDDGRGGMHGSSRTFHNYLWEVIHDGHKDEEAVPRPAAIAGGGAASTPIKVRYCNGDKNLVISVDLVPAIRLDGWPNEGIEKTWMMNHEQLESEGYQLVARPPHQDSRLGKSYDEQERVKLYCITFAELEVMHLSCSVQRIKDVYILAKCLRNPVVCQIVVRDSRLIHFVDKFITSYLLKTVFLHNYEKFLQHERPLIEMVYTVYCQLEYYLSKGYIPVFWVPSHNLLEGLKLNAPKAHKVAKHMKILVGGFYRRELGSDPRDTTNDDVLDVSQFAPGLDMDEGDAAELDILALPLQISGL